MISSISSSLNSEVKSSLSGITSPYVSVSSVLGTGVSREDTLIFIQSITCFLENLPSSTSLSISSSVRGIVNPRLEISEYISLYFLGSFNGLLSLIDLKT